MKYERENGLPKEVQERALWERLGKEYPLLYTEDFVLVDTPTTRLAIDDISYRATEPIGEDIETLMLTCKGWIEVYDARDVIMPFADKVKRLFDTMTRKRSVVIFPGNGASVVKDLLPREILKDVTSIALPAKRNVDTKGTVEGVAISDVTRARKVIADTKADSVVVIDDAIVTGATLRAIREVFPARGITWYAGSLLMRSPLQGKKAGKSGVEGYDAIVTPVVYQGTTGTPANNSLSTLIGNSEKSEVVRAKYIEDFVDDRQSFVEAVQRLQQKVTL